MEMKADGIRLGKHANAPQKRDRCAELTRAAVADASPIATFMPGAEHGGAAGRCPEAVTLVHEDLSFRGGRRLTQQRRDGMPPSSGCASRPKPGAELRRLAVRTGRFQHYRILPPRYEQKPPIRSALQRHQRVSATTGKKSPDGRSAGSGSGVEKGTKVRTEPRGGVHIITHRLVAALDCVRVLAGS